MIEVRLFATLRENRGKVLYFSPQHRKTYELLKELEIGENDIAILLINGVHSTFDSEIKDGDILSIFPPIGGG